MMMYSTNMTLRMEYFGGILFNNLGNLAFLDKKQAENVKAFIEERRNVDFDLLQLLLKENFMCLKNGKSNMRIIDNCSQGEYLSAPLSLHYYPSYLCNQKCKFCYNPTVESKTLNKKAIIDNAHTIIQKSKDVGVVIFNVLGGEPLCYFDILLEILKEASPYFYCSFATNGSACGGITSEMAKELAQIPNLDIRVSLQSCNRKDHNEIVNDDNAYDIAIKSIKILAEHNISCRISTVPTSRNFNQILQMVELAMQLGAKGFHLLPSMMTNSFNNTCDLWIDYSSQKKLVNELSKIKRNDSFEISYLNWFYNVENYEKIKKYKGQPLCVAGHEIMEIDPEGFIYPCSMVLGNSKYKMGNILKENLLDIWNSSKFDFLRNRETQLIESSKCKKCNFLSYCKGGCPFENELLYNNINNGSELCLF